MISNQAKIYNLNNLHPNESALVFDKFATSTLTFDQIIIELNEGHLSNTVKNYHKNSLKHTFLNLAFENISYIAVELIKSNSDGVFTEKPAKYQSFDDDKIYIPKIFYANPHIKESYLEAIHELFKVYKKSINPIQDAVFKLNPKGSTESEETWKEAIKSKSTEVSSFLLPNCTLTDLGVTMNLSTWEDTIVRLLSHPLHEIREIGERIRNIILGTTPNLVQNTDPSKYYSNNESFLLEKSDTLTANIPSPEYDQANKLEIDLLYYDKEGENKILASLIFKYEAISYRQALDKTKSLPQTEKDKIFKKILGSSRKPNEKVPNELSQSFYTFDCLLDQATYHELNKKQFIIQTPQILHGQYGYYTPKIFTQIVLEDEYKKAMDKAHDVSLLIAKDYPYNAQYITTNATARKCLMKINLHQIFELANLEKNSSAMYTATIELIINQINKVHPNMGKYLNINKY